MLNKLMTLIFLFSISLNASYANDDSCLSPCIEEEKPKVKPIDAMWTYEPDSEAIEKYRNGGFTFKCDIKHNDKNTFLLIKQAGIYKVSRCEKYISQIIRKYKDNLPINFAYHFYLYRIGHKDSLYKLVDLFKNNYVSDSISIEFLGYIEDWPLAGSMLLKLLTNSDGAKSEVICSALAWKRGLHGESSFKKNFYHYGNKLKIEIKRLDHYFQRCVVH